MIEDYGNAHLPQSRLPAQPDARGKKAARVACVSDGAAMTSNRPYLLRALVRVDQRQRHDAAPAGRCHARRACRCPLHRQGWPAWCSTSPRARSPAGSGQSTRCVSPRDSAASANPVAVPLAAILAIYAQETGQGMMLPEDGATMPDDPAGRSARAARGRAQARRSPADSEIVPARSVDDFELRRHRARPGCSARRPGWSPGPRGDPRRRWSTQSGYWRSQHSRPAALRFRRSLT